MPNQRISELPETTSIRSSYIFEDNNNEDSIQEKVNINTSLLLTATPNISNNKISLYNFKKSILDNSLFKYQEQTISGRKTFTERCSIDVTKPIPHKNLYINKNINERETNDATIFLDENSIKLSSPDSIFLAANYTPFFISKEKSLNIKTYQGKGALNVGGDAYINNIYIKYRNKYKKLPFRDTEDETVCFTEPLTQGELYHKIILPKTFKYKPIININLFQQNSPIFIPHCIRRVDLNSFEIKFGAKIPRSDYKVHVVASSSSIDRLENFNDMSDARTTQRFHARLFGNKKAYEIDFPEPYSTKPAISLCIETEGDIVNHCISSVNNKSFLVHFSDKINQDYTIHIFSQPTLT